MAFYCTGTGYKQRWSSTLNSESALRSPESITAAMDSVPIQFFISLTKRPCFAGRFAI